MKTLRFLILGLLLTATMCRGQNMMVTNTGLLAVDSLQSLGVTNDMSSGDNTNETVQVQANMQPMIPPTPPIIAEYVTPEIQALADGMQDNPLQIYNYVHDHIRYVLYFGSKKGAELTLLEKKRQRF